jgi:hypothetical protein
MSLATLKKKTTTLYHSMSVNKPQFSLNGFYRNDRSLPSTNRIQTSIPRTLARGNQLRGYGGNNGKFQIKIISTLCEQPQVEQTNKLNIKLSTKNIKGLIATKYLWTKLPNPYTWVKKQNDSLKTSSKLYTENLSKQVIKSIISINNLKSATLNECNFTKIPNTLSQNEFILKLSGNCINNIVNNVYNLPSNIDKSPILGKY